LPVWFGLLVVRKAHSKRKTPGRLQRSRRKEEEEINRSFVHTSQWCSSSVYLCFETFLSSFLSFLLHAVFSFTPWSTDLTVRRLGNKQSVMRTQEELEHESKSDKVESEEKEFPDKRSNASTERERESYMKNLSS
jgi:hypothetical protein